MCSEIFASFRALGLASNGVPLTVVYHRKRKENYAVTCVGNAFHSYSCSKLAIRSVSDYLEESINYLTADGKFIFAASGCNVYGFENQRKVTKVYKGHTKPVWLLLPFGDHLISIDESSLVYIWTVATEEAHAELKFENDTFKVTSILHPSTYLNKVVFGSQRGGLQLWNLKSCKLIYTFRGWDSAVTSLAQAPAIDVVAIGLRNGEIKLHNLRYDETVVSFKQDWGAVTSISFRTDDKPLMATGCPIGHIAVWDLEGRKLHSQIREAHDAAVTGLHFLPQEPLLVTSSSDNSLKIWIFDLPDGGGRLLRERSGHSAPPRYVKYHDNQGKTILSAGQDSTLRSFSTEHDRNNRSLGRASFNKKESKKSGLKKDQHKMPPIIQFDSEPSCQSDWDSIVAVHRNLCQVTTWNYQRFTMGKHRLEHPRFKEPELKNTTALTSCITACGNFCVIGYSSGHADVYNIQSGLHRGSYGNKKAHQGAVRGVQVDALNEITVTTGADNYIRFWRFKMKTLLNSLELESQVSKLLLQRHSSLLAAALDDFSLIIVDMDTARIVRKYPGHYSSITDMTFSSDGRWLTTAGMDATIRTWDLPTGRLLDCFLVESPVTSLTMSPLGDFLVTTHIDKLGLYLWSNRTLYFPVALKALPADFQPQMALLPTTSHKSQGLIEEKEDDSHEGTTEGSIFKSPEQISNELVTLSLLPTSRWYSLLHLDVIKKRNKPKQPVKVPKNAPFFLPSMFDEKSKTEEQDTKLNKDQEEEKKVSRFFASTELSKMLLHSQKNESYKPVMDYLKSIGPSRIDSEVRSLSPEMGGSVELMQCFLKSINISMKTKMNFELVQAYLGLFLKLHGEEIIKHEELTESLKEVQATQTEMWQELNHLFNQSLFLTGFMRSSLV